MTLFPHVSGFTTIGEMMWHEEHCIYRDENNKCQLDGDDCPWQKPVKTIGELHDWYPCFRAQGRDSEPRGCE